MDSAIKAALWHQFGAAIDTLGAAIRACPDPLWRDRALQPEFWYSAFHALFFLDYNLSPSAEGFQPPAPFTLAELDPAGVLPERVYEREELLAYLAHGRAKCRAAIAGLTAETAQAKAAFERPGASVVELMLYNLRHVQHHAAQLNLLLRLHCGAAPRWISSAEDAPRAQVAP